MANSATSSALISDSGATMESTKEIISQGARRDKIASSRHVYILGVRSSSFVAGYLHFYMQYEAMRFCPLEKPPMPRSRQFKIFFATSSPPGIEFSRNRREVDERCMEAAWDYATNLGLAFASPARMAVHSPNFLWLVGIPSKW